MKFRWHEDLARLLIIVAALGVAGCNPGGDDSGPETGSDSSDVADSSDASDLSDPSDASSLSDPSDPSTQSDTTDASDQEESNVYTLTVTLPERDASNIQHVELLVTATEADGTPIVGQIFEVEASPEGALIPTRAESTNDAGEATLSFIAAVTGDIEIEGFMTVDMERISIGRTSVTIESGACISSRDFFDTRLWGPVIQQCSSCHNSMGRALELNPYVMSFPFDGEADFLTLAYDQMVSRGFTMANEEYGELP